MYCVKTRNTNWREAWSFPRAKQAAPLMGCRAKPRLEMKLQASAPPPAIMALHALSTTPMQAPRKPKFTVHWVRLQHTISLSEDKSPSPLDQKTEAKVWNSVIPAEHFEQYGAVPLFWVLLMWPMWSETIRSQLANALLPAPAGILASFWHSKGSTGRSGSFLLLSWLLYHGFNSWHGASKLKPAKESTDHSIS